MKTIRLTCATCIKAFDKETREYTRQLKRGRDRFFCSRTCAAITNNQENPRPNTANLISENRKDDFTSFRPYVNRGNYRGNRGKRKYGCDLTVEFLKKLWDKQSGICPLTGWQLILANNTAKAFEEASPRNASLDRIDNSIGYMQGNVRFISVMANYARQSYSDEQLIDFCKAVAKNL